MVERTRGFWGTGGVQGVWFHYYVMTGSSDDAVARWATPGASSTRTSSSAG